MCQTGNNLLCYLDKQKQGEIPWFDISLFQFVEIVCQQTNEMLAKDIWVNNDFCEH